MSDTEEEECGYCMVVHGHPSECDHFKEIWDDIDKGDDDALSFGELKRGLQLTGENPTNADIREMMEECDVNGDGKLDYMEWVGLVEWMHKKAQKDNFDILCECLKEFDDNDDGEFTRDELLQFLDNYGDDDDVGLDDDGRKYLMEMFEDEDGADDRRIPIEDIAKLLVPNM